MLSFPHKWTVTVSAKAKNHTVEYCRNLLYSIMVARMSLYADDTVIYNDASDSYSSTFCEK